MPAGFTSARFVGRERELTQLAIALDQASVGRPTTVLVAGSSGIGVSRLLTEAQQRLAGMSEPYTVVRGEPTAATPGRPYPLVVAALQPLPPAPSDDDPSHPSRP